MWQWMCGMELSTGVSCFLQLQGLSSFPLCFCDVDGHGFAFVSLHIS